MTTEKVEGVAADQVGIVVQDFVDDGAIKVEATKKEGKWDITATKP